jgi:hypothetical protein
MNAPKKYVVSRTLKAPIWRDTTIIRDNVVETVRLANRSAAAGAISDPLAKELMRASAWPSEAGGR